MRGVDDQAETVRLDAGHSLNDEDGGIERYGGTDGLAVVSHRRRLTHRAVRATSAVVRLPVHRNSVVATGGSGPHRIGHPASRQELRRIATTSVRRVRPVSSTSEG